MKELREYESSVFESKVENNVKNKYLGEPGAALPSELGLNPFYCRESSLAAHRRTRLRNKMCYKLNRIFLFYCCNKGLIFQDGYLNSAYFLLKTPVTATFIKLKQ